MQVTNENQEDTPLLTKADLAMASYALAETFNSFLLAYNEEDYGEATKEEFEASMNHLRMAFIKFDSMLNSINKEEDETQGEPDENQDEETSP